MKQTPSNNRVRVAAGGLLAVALLAAQAGAHLFICPAPYLGCPEVLVGTAPQSQGQGWVCDAYVDIPDESAGHLVAAEQYANTREPDWVFHTQWIDFPPGPQTYDLDTNFSTLHDFLGDDIVLAPGSSSGTHDVGPIPFGHLLLRCRGIVNVRLEDDSLGVEGLPVWTSFGAFSYDGFRLKTGNQTVFRRVLVQPNDGFFVEHPIFFVVGLVPIEVTYFNRHDPANKFAGVEFYSYYADGLPWPAGESYIDPTLGAMTVVPPTVIYQPEDAQPLIPGDYDRNSFVDLSDLSRLAICVKGPDQPVFDIGCEVFYTDDDIDVDLVDLAALQNYFSGPSTTP